MKVHGDAGYDPADFEPKGNPDIAAIAEMVSHMQSAFVKSYGQKELSSFEFMAQDLYERGYRKTEGAA